MSGAQSTDVLPRLLAMEAAGSPVVTTYRKPGAGLVKEAMEDQDIPLLAVPFVGLVTIASQAQRRCIVEDSWLSGTMSFPLDLDEEGLHSADKTSLARAISLRLSAT